MATSFSIPRSLVVLVALLALLAASLVVTVRPAHATVACTGASEIIDVGGYYIVKGTKGDDYIDCSDSPYPVEIRGNSGNDDLWGSAFADTLKGGWGDDELYGLAGNDYLFGGWGSDYMDGGADYDVCLGGKGWDWTGGGSSCEYVDLGQDQ